jgi:CxxC motif-containing protein
MLKNYTCIICPNGCEIEAETIDGRIISIEGAACRKGKEYVTREESDPVRNIASSVLLLNGELPLASVRLTRPIPKDKIFDVINEIKKIRLEAQVKIGDVVIKNILGLESDLIITKNIARIN